MKSNLNEPINFNLRYADREHMQQRYKQYQELKRKKEMPLSERKAEQLAKLKKITRK